MNITISFPLSLPDSLPIESYIPQTETSPETTKHLAPSLKLEIAKYCHTHGPTATIKHFKARNDITLSDSTVRRYTTRFRKLLTQLSLDQITSEHFEDKKSGAPS